MLPQQADRLVLHHGASPVHVHRPGFALENLDVRAMPASAIPARWSPIDPPAMATRSRGRTLTGFPSPQQMRQHELAGLCARECRPSVDDKGGDSGNALPSCPGLGCPHLLGALIASEERPGALGRDASKGGKVGKHGNVADIPAFDEVGPERCLHQFVLAVFLLGQPDQSMRVERVRGPRHQRVAKLDTLLSTDSRHLRVPVLRALPRAELGAAVREPIHPSAGMSGLSWNGRQRTEDEAHRQAARRALASRLLPI